MKLMSVTVTYNGKYPHHNEGFIHYIDEEANIDFGVRVSYTDGMRELRKLEKRLQTIAMININRYDAHICEKYLAGVIR